MISIVIPAFDEEDRVGATLTRVTEWLDGRAEDYEVIVADDGSRDRTVAIVAEHTARQPRVRVVVLPENRGKGAAVRAGVLAARGDEVLFSDADLSTPIEELVKLRAAIGAGADIAIGSRAAAGADILVRQHPVREMMGRTFNLIVRGLMRGMMGGLRDTQCGFKLFRGDVARELFARSTVDGFAFDVEILLLARPRYKVAEVPVVWRHVEQSKVSPGVDAARMFWDVAKLSMKRRRRS